MVQTETRGIWEPKFGFKGQLRWKQPEIQKANQENLNKQEDKGMIIGKQGGRTS